MKFSAFQISAVMLISLVSISDRLLSEVPVTNSPQAISASYGKLPLNLEANQGQTDSSVQFLSHGQGYTLFLRQGEAVLALHSPAPADKSQPPASESQSAVVTLRLIGGNSNAAVSGEGRQITRTNYFLGNNPARWRTDIPNYGLVRYHSVYDGIDLVYYGNQHRLEHDFVVAPNADPSKIVLELSGSDTAKIDPATGDLILTAGQSTLRLLKPTTYQEIHGHRAEVPSSYRLISRNRVAFSLGRYIHAHPLIIDPVLVYSTYLGGSGSSYNGLSGDQGNGIAVDSAENAYVVGIASSIDFPVTASAFQTENNSAKAGNGGTVFITKFNADGSRLLYSTFLGGSGESQLVFGSSGGEAATAVAVDSQGNAYVTGWTKSADFPVTAGAFQTTNKSAVNGTPSAFVAKLNQTGSALIYSTYLGGTMANACYDWKFVSGQAGQAIAVDANGSAYIAGGTFAHDFPVTPNAFQPSYPASSTGGNSGFVTKLSSDGSSLLYSTYLGGSGSGAECYVEGDQVSGIALDSFGDAYLTGSTASSDFPVTSGALQLTLTGNTNAFVTELNLDGSAEIVSTFLGGSEQDGAGAIVLGQDGSIFLAGNTTSADFPTTAGVLQPTLPNSYGFVAGFVTKLKPDASALEYSTFLGGPLSSLSGLAVDSAGSTYVTGATGDAPFPSTPDAPMQFAEFGLETPYEVFVAKLNPSATGLDFATMLGSPTGVNYSGGSAVALDSAGNLYVTGYAGGNDFPVTAAAFQRTNHIAAHGFEQGSAFAAKLALAGDTTGHTPTITSINASSAQVKQGQPVTLTATVTGEASTPAPTGSVTIGGSANSFAGVIALPAESVSLNASGTAVETNSTLGPGLYSAAAFYSGDTTHLSSNSYPSSVATFRVVGPPAILTGSDDGGPDPTYSYGQAFAGLRVFVTDSSGFGLGGITINFSGPGLSFYPSNTVVSAGDGYAYVVPIANSVGNLIVTVSVDRVTPLQFPMTVLPAPLTVKVQPSAAGRRYGAANPAFTNVVTGLVHGDILGQAIIVTLQTQPTAASPVGVYPVAAQVSGPAVANYSLTLENATLTIFKAPLYISAKNVAITYGQTPSALSLYTISGFVNGDTQASATTGAPSLTTTVTATTPVGFYRIGVAVGTLAATSYYFNTFSSGEGSVGVYKAPLTIHPNSFTIHVGDPLPTFTYTISGFVNSDTQASATSGAPVLTTTAPSTSKPGSYYIVANIGTLTAHNYWFNHPDAATNGILTITK